MNNKRPSQLSTRILISAIVLVSIYFIGTLGYMLIEKMNFLDSAFMTAITISTVGYGVVKELSNAGTVFTIFLIVIGAGTAAYIFISVTDYLLSELLLGGLQRKRMDKMISKLNNHYILCGLGRVGKEAALELCREDMDFIVIDKEEKQAVFCKEKEWLFIHGDATSDEVLIKAGVKKAKALLATLGSDSSNMFVSLSAKELNPKIFTVVRATIEETISKLKKAGADKVVSPQIIGGKRMVHLAKHPTLVDFLDSIIREENIEIRLAEIQVEENSKLDGLTIEQAKKEYGFEAIIISLLLVDKKLVYKAKSETKVRAGSKLIAVGTKDQIQKISELAITKDNQ